MKILVINCGSSSIKYKLYEMDDQSVLAAGGIAPLHTELTNRYSMFHNNKYSKIILKSVNSFVLLPR